MKKVRPIIFSAFASLTLAAAMWALPVSPNNPAAHLNVAAGQDVPQTQSVTGKIASFDKSSFTLTVASTAGKSFTQEATPKVMSFTIDKNTTVDGTLKVNASADVTYRQDTNGSNIAISVRVTP